MPTDCSDYISPEDIQRRQDRAQSDARTRRDLLLLWALAIVVIVLVG
jgi:hypothetical protein